MKKQIRQQILAQREVLTDEVLSHKSNIIFNKLKNLPEYNNAKNIMIYMDFRKEVKTDLIIDDLLITGKKIMLPLTIPKTKGIIVSELINPKLELKKNKFGILEPKKQYIRERDPEILDLIIMPCIAFNTDGYRIGYGAGYYDRFFSNLKRRIPSLGLAFDFQIIDYFYPEPHDSKVDIIVTESKIINCI